MDKLKRRVFGNRKLMIIDFYIYIEEEENFAVAIIIFESGCMILSNVVVNLVICCAQNECYHLSF
ncbi:hypothetical protein DERF_001953 [Dermatophagoides farinae]|uniref:Uncharacterized protein n=1 Tax=Dermatophagoides farinae TaxID=6954 RepID=A0A922IAI6_DERFA|nr:hypothetical protein DERF_001953 [Dermatophagoides farinae]